MSAGQYGRRTFLKTTGAIVAISLPTAAHAAPADSAAASGDPTDAREVLDVDFVGEVNDLHDDGDRTDAQAEELVTSATLLSSTILQSASS